MVLNKKNKFRNRRKLIKKLVGKRKKDEIVIGFFIALALLFFVLHLVFYDGIASITGYSILEGNEVGNSEDLEEEIIDGEIPEEFGEEVSESEIEKIVDGFVYIFDQIFSNVREERGSGGGGVEKYHITGLSEELSLWNEGEFLLLDNPLKGYFRFSLYREKSKIAEFNLNVSEDINISDILANTSEDEAFFYSYGDYGDIDLFVPRISGHTKVRICENASSFEEIYEGCINNSGVTKEYVLELDEVELSENRLFFIIRNISGGGRSEGEKKVIKELEIELISPFENSGDDDGEILFQYNVSSENHLEYCKLIIDDSVLDIDYGLGIDNFTAFVFGDGNFKVENLKKGKHFWEVSCKDIEGNIRTSSKRKVTVISIQGFELPKNLNNVDLEKIEELFLKRTGFGLISFLESINLSRIENLSDYVVIQKNFISIDSENFPELNKPAVLTFYGLDFENPVILKDGEPCEDCEILSYDGNLVFRVNNFSNYSATENSAMLIWDKTVGGSIVFYSNYTKVADNTLIEGATCTVDYGDGSKSMNYGGGLYSYSAPVGSGTATVSCSAAGYTSIVLTDYFSSNSGSGINGATYSNEVTTTAPDDDPDVHTALAGNVTYFDVFGYTTTQSWQGYYGDVSGTIELASGSESVLYNWSVVSASGEVYASRTFDVNFASIGCADAGEISGEESAMGQESGDVDSVSNTFNQNNHPGFYVGSIEITLDACKSANLFGSGDFYETLLADDASNIVYTSILGGGQGFDGNNYDFEMIVSENGKDDNIPTLYYFYAEFA